MGTIYLLHFSKPYKHARHYIGYTDDLDKRLARHLIVVVFCMHCGSHNIKCITPGHPEEEKGVSMK